MAIRKKKSKIQSNSVSTPQITMDRSPEFRVIYSNTLKLASSPVEVRLTFAHITDNVGEGTGLLNEEEFCVCINPVIAKLMLAQIEELLRNHEKLWGIIEIPKAMMIPQVEALLGQEKTDK